jgi:hypothetical protein
MGHEQIIVDVDTGTPAIGQVAAVLVRRGVEFCNRSQPAIQQEVAIAVKFLEKPGHPGHG